ncbi:hypothetical protein FPSM_01206 [Flavobacterium psychrophilum]|nr:hypothetical protein FPSM_01206 [Flavobacterium psychrophilum]
MFLSQKSLKKGFPFYPSLKERTGEVIPKSKY